MYKDIHEHVVSNCFHEDWWWRWKQK